MRFLWRRLGSTARGARAFLQAKAPAETASSVIADRSGSFRVATATGIGIARQAKPGTPDTTFAEIIEVQEPGEAPYLVFNDPKTKIDRRVLLTKGTRVETLGKKLEWREVRVLSGPEAGRKGLIRSKFLAPISAPPPVPAASGTPTQKSKDTQSAGDRLEKEANQYGTENLVIPDVTNKVKLAIKLIKNVRDGYTANPEDRSGLKYLRAVYQLLSDTTAEAKMSKAFVNLEADDS